MEVEGFQMIHATPEDAGDICDFANETAGETDFYSFGRNEFSYTAETKAEEIRGKVDSAVVILIREKSETGKGLLVGWGEVNPRDKRRSKHIFWISLAIRKAFWRRGLGKWLFDELMKAADETLKAEKVILCVNTTNTPALKLYEKYGFENEGVLKGFTKVGDVYYDLVNLGKWIRKPDGY